jgi:hypothetical protein
MVEIHLPDREHNKQCWYANEKRTTASIFMREKRLLKSREKNQHCACEQDG